VAVKISTCIQEASFESRPEHRLLQLQLPFILSVPLLSHDRLLPSPVQFVIHSTPPHTLASPFAMLEASDYTRQAAWQMAQAVT
jgi:hypothetical protein